MATIKQIAERAGVSPTTVSNVLHKNYSKVSKEKINLITCIAQEMEYTPNVGAMLLAGKKTKIVGVITNYSTRYSIPILLDPFVGEIIASIESELRLKDYYTMLTVAQSEEEVVRLAKTWNVSGLVILGLEPDDCADILRKARVPVVFIDCYFRNEHEQIEDSVKKLYHNIGLEDFRGGYEMTQYLISLGHKKIVFLGDQEIHDTVNNLRYQGYKKALEEAFLQEPLDICLYMSRSLKECRCALEQLCLYRENNGLDAVFFCSDFYAFNAIQYFNEKGLRIPEDIAIAGFDDNYFAKVSNPSLTTVHQDVFQRGRAAVSMLDAVIKGEKILENNLCFPVSLVIRNST